MRIQAAWLLRNGSAFIDALAHRILYDADYAVVEAKARNRTKQGKVYENGYCWVIEVRDGKMASIVEYADTTLMESALAPLDE